MTAMRCINMINSFQFYYYTPINNKIHAIIPIKTFFIPIHRQEHLSFDSIPFLL